MQSVLVDDQIIEKTKLIFNTQSTEEAIEKALQEFIKNNSRSKLLELFNSNGLADDYDYKALREGR